jgi:hypothetical protein
MTGSAGQDAQTVATDFDSGARETVPEPSDPVADHAKLLGEMIAAKSATSGGWQL